LLRARGAPAPVRAASVACLALAHALGRPLAQRWRQAAMVTGVLEMAAVQVFFIEKAKDTSGQGRRPLNARQLLKMVAGRLALQVALDRALSGSLGGPRARGVHNALLAAFVARASQLGTKSQPGQPSVFLLALVGWALALLTDQPWLYFYCGGYLATLAQGVSHHYSGEEGTLPQLTQIADDIGHTTFFPNLLLHSVWQSATSGRGPAFPASKAGGA